MLWPSSSASPHQMGAPLSSRPPGVVLGGLGYDSQSATTLLAQAQCARSVLSGCIAWAAAAENLTFVPTQVVRQHMPCAKRQGKIGALLLQAGMRTCCSARY